MTVEATGESNSFGGGAVRWTYQLDAIDRVTKTIYPDGGRRSTRVEADQLGRLTSYTYDTFDRLVSTTRPDGTTETQTYDAENRRWSSTGACWQLATMHTATARR
jgi:YD repeat-containing protein